jgi:hypothetical protein
LKRSAGLETVACWQTDAQWTEREVRDQLDALFAHRVYFATASAQDARDAVRLTMAEFSDTVRPGMEHLSSLGRPDVRLHLPRHHAIASWVTPEGRQPAFVAETLPLSVDRERLALHAARQAERGARHLGELRQPHWDEPHGSAAPRGSRRADTATSIFAARAGAGQAQAPIAPPGTSPPAATAVSFRELVELDGAHSVRWGKQLASVRSIEPDGTDLAMLELIAIMGHVLTSQLHRRFNPTRAATTTQRRLKRLSDAGLVVRFQFHRRDGGGVPMCYVIAPAGLELLARHGHDRAARERAHVVRVSAAESSLRHARHDVHVAGWALALVAALHGREAVIRGAEESALSPPARASEGGRGSFGVNELRLPGGRAPHSFLRDDGDGRRVEVERFETVRPDATVEIRAGEDGPPSDVLVELDDRLGAAALRKLERYDHFLTGWSLHTPRYGRRGEAVPRVAFVCRDRARARECARRADQLLCACRAYPGEYPSEWEYPSREGVVWAAERDVHEGILFAVGLPRLPPGVRISVADGDPRAGEATFTPVALV